MIQNVQNFAKNTNNILAIVLQCAMYIVFTSFTWLEKHAHDIKYRSRMNNKTAIHTVVG